jgi:hypothetical protein
MVWDERVETTERFPPGECIEACSGIFGGQRSVVAMVWSRRVETTERFPPEMVSRAYLCSVKWHAFSEACTKKVGRKMRPTCVEVLFRWT